MLRAGEVVAGYVVGQQHWRWLDDGAVKELLVELSPVAEGEPYVPTRRVLVRLRVPVHAVPAVGYGPHETVVLRAAIERVIDNGGPWV